MCDQAMIQQARVHGMKAGSGSRADKSIKQDRHLCQPCGQDCPANRRKFQPANAAQCFQPVGHGGPIGFNGLSNDADFVVERITRYPCAWAGPILRLPPKKGEANGGGGGRVADPHFA